MATDLSLDHARDLDEQDPLAGYREHFIIADEDLIYLDGNSLGRLPKDSVARLHAVVEEEWGTGLIRSWGTGWYEAPVRIGEKLARLLGAAPGQVIVSDSTTVNLFKLVLAALRAQPGRRQVVGDTLNFPSDLYVLQGCADLLGDGYALHLVPSTDDVHLETRAVLDALDEGVALVALSHVVFKSGYILDVEAITRRAHEVGALVLWDLCHSAGALPIELDRWGVDLAVGCTYKYLNGGPGAPAFLYVRHELQERLRSPIWGWFGEETPFAFELAYRPAPGIRRFLAGTPPTLSLAAIEPALDLILTAGIEAIRAKSIALTEYAIALHDAVLAPLGFTLRSPREAARRGSQVSLGHPAGYQIACCLIEEMGVIPDFREPDNLRLGFAPLYTCYAEVWEAVDRLRRVMEEGRYHRWPATRGAVT